MIQNRNIPGSELIRPPPANCRSNLVALSAAKNPPSSQFDKGGEVITSARVSARGPKPFAFGRLYGNESIVRISGGLFLKAGFKLLNRRGETGTFVTPARVAHVAHLENLLTRIPSGRNRTGGLPRASPDCRARRQTERLRVPLYSPPSNTQCNLLR